MKSKLLACFPVFATALLAVTPAACQPRPGNGNPVEVGQVSWGRDHDAALAAAKKTGKPVFLLFQEVPGCAGCVDFGRSVLSDPEVVAAVEKQFTPLLVRNNSPGKEAEILKRYQEPAWNYQVVRFLDAEGRDLIPRKDRVWTKPELMARMAAALEKAGRPPMTATTRRVAFSQACFWTGEMKLGGIDGVIRTEAGFLDGHEVTVVDYDPEKISLDALTRQAAAAGVANGSHLKLDGYRKAPESDQKRQLQGTKYARMKLTPEQATKVNAFARTEPDKADAFLGK